MFWHYHYISFSEAVLLQVGSAYSNRFIWFRACEPNQLRKPKIKHLRSWFSWKSKLVNRCLLLNLWQYKVQDQHVGTGLVNQRHALTDTRRAPRHVFCRSSSKVLLRNLNSSTQHQMCFKLFVRSLNVLWWKSLNTRKGEVLPVPRSN